MSGRYKDCYCFTCDRDFHHMGIARHRAAHRDRAEDCKIMFSDGRKINYRNSRRQEALKEETT